MERAALCENDSDLAVAKADCSFVASVLHDMGDEFVFEVCHGSSPEWAGPSLGPARETGMRGSTQTQYLARQGLGGHRYLLWLPDGEIDRYR